MAPHILIVDDEKNILLTLRRALELEGYRVEVAGGGGMALEALTARPYDLVLMDVRMPDLDGLEVLSRIQKLRPELPVVMMSGHATLSEAVRATQLGARDFLEKPLEMARLLVAVRNALDHARLSARVDELTARAAERTLLGDSAAMVRLHERVARAAPSEGRVLITGENGTGKELVARAIHGQSKRASGPFVKLNCAALPAELIESELFGHEKGAFTGALAARKGRFEQADGGTLFLDEVGDMPLAMQSKLLRVLQEGEFERVGGSETLSVDVRVIAATHRDLTKHIEAGTFREDLYYRLAVVPLHVAPLRERLEDVPRLAEAFLLEACRRNGYRPKSFGGGAVERMARHAWPGNVRELKNLVERLAILAAGEEILPADVDEALPAGRRPPVPTGGGSRYVDGVGFHAQVEAAEREILLGALAAAKDNVSEAARRLGLERGHFYKKMKAVGLRRGPEERGADAAEDGAAEPDPQAG